MEYKDTSQAAKKAEEFLWYLLEEGAKIPCDKSNSSFNGNFGILPPYYDEKKIKRCQKFFERNFFSMFTGMYYALIIGLSIPFLREPLMYTQKSSTPLTAYRRYFKTVQHLCLWYDSDFSSRSKIWQSLAAVRKSHNSVSLKMNKHGLGRITQKDMALVQLGFFSIILANGPRIGIHNAEREDLECVVHLWRVIGYVMGIEERFNSCSGSLEETVELCRVVSRTIVLPHADEKNTDFFEMASALRDSITYIVPLVPHFSVSLYYAYYLAKTICYQHIEDNDMFATSNLIELNTFSEKLTLSIMQIVFKSLKFTIVKLLLNCMTQMVFRFRERFPNMFLSQKTTFHSSGIL